MLQPDDPRSTFRGRVAEDAYEHFSDEDRAEVLQEAANSKVLGEWIAPRLQSIPLEQLMSERDSDSLALWFLTLTHFSTIARLVPDRRPATAMALIRPCWEALVRGLWIASVATDPQIGSFRRNDEPPFNFRDLIGRIERSARFPIGALDAIQRDSNQWKRLCSFTHGGYQALARLGFGGYNWSANDLLVALRYANSAAMLAALFYAESRGRQDLSDEIRTTLHLPDWNGPPAGRPLLRALG